MGASEYAGAVADMELCYRSIEPHGSLRGTGIGVIERAVRSHSLLQALSHRVSTSDECAAANLGHEEWVNPFTRVASNESFPEVFDRALKGWPTLSEAFHTVAKSCAPRLPASTTPACRWAPTRLPSLPTVPSRTA